MTTITYSWTEPNGTQHPGSTVDLKDTGSDPAFPIVILLHGLGGPADEMVKHMASPGVPNVPGNNFNLTEPVPSGVVDRDWHVYPNVGIWGFWFDSTIAVEGWEPYLNRNRYPTINYGQVDAAGLLARPIAQLDGLVQAVLARTNKRLVFVCHSRGGLLLRAFLQRNRSNVAVLPRIAGAITLHSPHQGSSVADLATTIHARISLVLSQGVAWFLAEPLRLLDTQVSSPGNQEMRTSSTFLADLRSRETTPLPVSIPIHTWGGTSSRLTRVRAWWFHSVSAMAQWHWPPFHWMTWPGPIAAWGPLGPVGILSVLDDIPWLTNLVPEARMGVGDTLVTDARSHLPFEASHRTNSLNHAEALWSDTLKGQVLSVLRNLR